MSSGADFSGTWIGSQTTPGGYLGHLVSVGVWDSSVNGAPTIVGSMLGNVTITGAPNIYNCNQNGSVFRCDAYVNGENVNNASYGCGYATPSVNLKNHLETTKEMYNSLKSAQDFIDESVEKNRLLSEEIKERFYSSL